MSTILWQWNGTDVSQFLTASAFGIGLNDRPSGSVSASLQTPNVNSIGTNFVRFRCAGLRTNINAAFGSAWIIPINLGGISLPKRYTIKISFPHSYLVSGANTNFKPMILHCTKSLASASFSGRGFGNYLAADNVALSFVCLTGGISQSTITTGLAGGGSTINIVGTGTFMEIEYNTGETPFARGHSPFYIKHKISNITNISNAKKSAALMLFTGAYGHDLSGIAWDGLALGFQNRLGLTPQYDNDSYIDIDRFIIYKHPLDE